MGCFVPMTIRLKMSNTSVAVPCGKCPECLKRRVSGWSFRLMQEEKVSSSAFFITLTYDTTHVPISRNGYMTLNKRDVQHWMMRLRKHTASRHPEFRLPPDHPDFRSIKYYLCGEYGSDNVRPHYHAIIFNVPDLIYIDQTWQLGTTHFGTVSGASVGYTLKYMEKQKRIPMHVNDDRIQEFSLMSKGLGKSYITEAVKRYHHADLANRMCLTIEDGKKVSMPRYYKQKIYNEHQQRAIAFHALRKAILEEKELIISKGVKYPDYVRTMVEYHKYLLRNQYKNSEKRQTL